MNTRHQRTLDRLTAARNHLEAMRADLRELQDFLPEAKYPAAILDEITEIRSQIAEARDELEDADFAADSVRREIRRNYL